MTRQHIATVLPEELSRLSPLCPLSTFHRAMYLDDCGTTAKSLRGTIKGYSGQSVGAIKSIKLARFVELTSLVRVLNAVKLFISVNLLEAFVLLEMYALPSISTPPIILRLLQASNYSLRLAYPPLVPTAKTRNGPCILPLHELFSRRRQSLDIVNLLRLPGLQLKCQT